MRKHPRIYGSEWMYKPTCFWKWQRLSKQTTIQNFNSWRVEAEISLHSLKENPCAILFSRAVTSATKLSKFFSPKIREWHWISGGKQRASHLYQKFRKTPSLWTPSRSGSPDLPKGHRAWSPSPFLKHSKSTRIWERYCPSGFFPALGAMQRTTPRSPKPYDFTMTSTKDWGGTSLCGMGSFSLQLLLQIQFRRVLARSRGTRRVLSPPKSANSSHARYSEEGEKGGLYKAGLNWRSENSKTQNTKARFCPQLSFLGDYCPKI